MPPNCLLSNAARYDTQSIVKSWSVRLATILALVWLFSGGCASDDESHDLDREIALATRRYRITAISPAPSQPPELVELGRFLFFDKELSGNRDTACATCHHPLFALGDGLSLSIGTGGEGFGSSRALGKARSFIPRNAPEFFNRGTPGWEVMFWDGRVRSIADGDFETPAGAVLPEGLTHLLAAQAMFPVTSRDEMRGHPGDRDVFGNVNELASFEDQDFPGIWRALMQRLLSVPKYVDLFVRAFPDIAPQAFGFQHAANAIAAFEIEIGNLTDTPWDRYLRGDTAAVSEAAKRGALVFLGKGRCAECHIGPLLTDQKFYVLAVPQVGPGKGAAAPEDFGRGGVTNRLEDRYAFRTPPLRNVAVTGPWMHDGAYTSLEAAVRHHLDAVQALQEYDVRQLDEHLQPLARLGEEQQSRLLANLDSRLREPIQLAPEELGDLLTFLHALTDPGVFRLQELVPDSVPSGLPVDR